MLSPSFLTRAGIGLAVTAVEKSMTLPGHLAGSAVRTYMHVGQTATDLANKGDAVLDAVFSRPEEQPEWATFDEDETKAPAEPFVSNGSVVRPEADGT